MIKSRILTQTEIKTFLSLLSKNNKKLTKNWNLIYHGKTDGFNDKICKKKCENKKNLLCLIQTDGGNVFGGYTSNGWKSGNNIYNRDDKAFVFGLRSSKQYEPSIANIKPDKVDQAMYSENCVYLIFGSGPAIFVSNNGDAYHYNPHCYTSLPTDNHFMRGNGGEKVIDIEVFQLI